MCSAPVLKTGSCSDNNACTSGDSCQASGCVPSGNTAKDTSCGSGGLFCDGKGACKCRTKSDGNLLKDPGFDSANGPDWVFRDGGRWTNSQDADGCSGSGAIDETSGVQPYFYQCISGGFSQGANYTFGHSFKTSSGGGDSRCRVLCYDGAGCMGNSLSEIDYSVNSTGSWKSGSGTDLIPVGTVSVAIDCTGGALGYYDQLFFTQASPSRF